MNVPKQWHVYVLDLEPRIGTKPGKQLPCLVVQPIEFGEGGLKSSVVLPLTTRMSPLDAWPLRIRVPKGTCGLKEASDLLIDQILAWDHSLFRDDLGEVPDAIRDQVKTALREFLDL
jgi:mRNA interferase MazF